MSKKGCRWKREGEEYMLAFDRLASAVEKLTEAVTARNAGAGDEVDALYEAYLVAYRKYMRALTG